MDFYQINLGVFTALNVFVIWLRRPTPKDQHASVPLDAASAESGKSTAASGASASASRFQLGFLLPYALAVAADWFQGPHIYAMYRYQKGIPEKVVAALYSAGFVSSGVSASFAGGLADRYGRKLACLLYCVLYILTCLSMLSDNLSLLFLGRLAGGVSTTLLFSVFETWMISSYHEQGLQSSHLQLSAVFGSMTTISCVTAILCGVSGDVLVRATGSRAWPFIASTVCSLLAGLLISTTWRENFGSQSVQDTSVDNKYAVRVIAKDPKILFLGLTSCVFEGSMYLFIFFWSAALKSARNASGFHEELPFGFIFSGFMCSMMAGSALFTYLNTPERPTQYSAGLLLNATLMFGCCLWLSVVLWDERLRFWVFCLLEGCIGVYFPAISCLKSGLVEDGIRGRVYSILRVPLNVFVVTAHSLDQEGDHHRNKVFLACGSLLVLVSLVSRKYL